MNNCSHRRKVATASRANGEPDAGGGHWKPLVGAATVAVMTVAGTLAAGGTELGYDSYRIDTGEADRRYLFAGRLTGRATEDLVVLSVTGQTVSVGIYSRDGDTFTRVRLAEVPPSLWYFDVMRLGGEDALLARGRGDIYRFDPTTGTFEPLVSRPSRAHRSGGPEERERPLFPPFDFARDLNGDGLDDILRPFPEDSGFGVWIQRRDGGFADPVVLASEPDMETGIGVGGFGFHYRHAIRRLDHDGDGVEDLALAVEGGLDIHRGLATGGWDADPTRVPLEAVAEGRLFFLGQEAGEFVVRPMLRAVEDFNGDGVGDVATRTTSENQSSTRYDFHFGLREGGGTLFRGASDTSIFIEGTIALSEFSDLDGDGDWDFCAVPLKMGVGTVLSGLFRKSVRVDMNCYRMADGTYPREPSARWRKRIPLDVPSPGALADLTGDGLLDAVIPAGRTRLDVHPGTGGADLFAAEPIGVEVDLPAGEETIQFRDLNGDGRADLLVVSQDGGKPVWVALSR